MTHTVIRGLTLHRIWMIFSINNRIINKNQSTKIQELMVHIISRNLLFHENIKVHITIAARITAIMSGIIFEVFQQITKNLHIT